MPLAPPQPAKAKKPDLCKNSNAVNFVRTYQADAATVANQLKVPTENVLGLSGIESKWGTTSIARFANNFFGLHDSPNDAFAGGKWITAGGTAVSKFPSYLASAQSFAARYGGVASVTDPTKFAETLVKLGFNPGKLPFGNPTFVKDTAGAIDATRERMKCP